MLRLHKGLNSAGAESRLLVRQTTGQSNTSAVFDQYVPETERLALHLYGSIIQCQGIDRNRTPISNTAFTFPYPGFDLSEHPSVAWADVINLHWPSYILSPTTLARLQDTGKPIFWTIHDQWAFTGGCHYAAGCEKYLNDCADCPQLSGEMSVLPSLVLREKQAAMRRVHIVGPSRWIADCARRSTLLRSQPIHHIANGIEHDIFCPQSKSSARSALGIPADGFLLLFGADHLGEIRKGWAYLNRTLHAAVKRLQGRVPIRLAFFGNMPSELGDLPIPLHPLGYIDRDEQLAIVYNAADLFILSSLEDNQPNTLMEAMACGTPVAGFDVGALPDIIRHNENGLLAPKADADALSASICEYALSLERQRALPAAARETILKSYRLSNQADSYLTAYREALAGAPHPRRSNNPASSSTTSTLVGDFDRLRTKRDFVRPTGQLLRNLSGNPRTFDPGWSFGAHKEKKRFEHYLRAWLDIQSPDLRAYLIGDHQIYDLEAISLHTGFSEPNGPFPELNIPQFIIWGKLPTSRLLLRTPVPAKSKFRIEFQNPSAGLSLRLRVGDKFLWEGILEANFTNPTCQRTIIEVLLESLPGNTIASLDYILPPGMTQKDNLGVAFFKIEILPPC